MKNRLVLVACVLMLLVSPSICLDARSQEAESADTRMTELLNSAQAAIDSGRHEEAVGVLREILALEENHALARKALIDTLMRLFRTDEAWDEAVVLHDLYPQDPQALYLKAAVAYRKGEFQNAAEFAGQAIALDETYVDAYRLQAFSYFLLKDYENYKTSLNQLIAIKPNDAEAHYHLGRYYYENDQFSDGIETFKKAAALDPSHYKAYFFLGWCQQAGGDTAGAKQSFRTSAEIVGTMKIAYGWPFADLGDLLVTEGDYEEGIGWMYRGVRNDPELPYTHCKYAEALLKTEESGEIEHHLKKAIELDPGYAQAYYVLGRYYTKTGDREKAKEALTQFQELRKNPTISAHGIRRGDR